jgi:glycosyltransferase involved in cell wall biosynthesis
MITGITKVRNESLIIEDTLKHFLGFCDSVILYDDASTDDTADIAESFDRVAVIRGTTWRLDRPREETRHRQLLLEQVKTPWTWCFDADERLVGELPELTADGYRFRLFDGYMSPDYSLPFTQGKLVDLPRLWGPEFRDILMLFKTDKASYFGLDKREPAINGQVVTANAYIKHYGKCLSVEHWEETCEYYAAHWPEPYRSKWAGRRGKAIHIASDFGRSIYAWSELMVHPKAWVRL